MVHALLALLMLLPKAAKPDLTADAKKKYQAALQAGRQLEDKGKLDDAMQQFQAALAIVSEDGPTLSEMGVVAFRKKDLKAAEDYTRRSIRSTDDANVKGASLYNLGRILEEKKDKAGAIAAYEASLQARPHHVVRERLATLDPKRAAALDPLAPKPLDGPFKSVEDWCKTQPNEGEVPEDDKEHAADYGFECDGSPDDELVMAPKARVNGDLPIGSVRPVLVYTSVHGKVDKDRMVALHFAVQTGGVFFVTESLGMAEAAYRDASSMTIDPPGASGGHLIVSWTESGGGYTGCCETDSSRDKQAVIGVGPSGKPSITGTIVTREHYEEGDRGEDAKPTTKRDWDLSVTVGKKDLVIKAGHGKNDMDAAELRNLLGTHPLAFP